MVCGYIVLESRCNSVIADDTRIVGLSEPNAGNEPQWHLFNDFLVRQISKEEALHFDASWKLPSILAYQVKSVNGRIDNSWKNNLDTSILYRRWSTG